MTEVISLLEKEVNEKRFLYFELGYNYGNILDRGFILCSSERFNVNLDRKGLILSSGIGFKRPNKSRIIVAGEYRYGYVNSLWLEESYPSASSFEVFTNYKWVGNEIATLAFFDIPLKNKML